MQILDALVHVSGRRQGGREYSRRHIVCRKDIPVLRWNEGDTLAFVESSSNDIVRISSGQASSDDVEHADVGMGVWP